MKATKKKKSPIVEDFIDSLVDDLNASESLTEKSKTVLDTVPTVAAPLGPVALGKKNRGAVMLVSDSNHSDTEEQNSSKTNLEKSNESVLSTNITGINMAAPVAPTNLEKLKINEEVTQSMPEIEVFGLDDSHVLKAVTPTLKTPSADSVSKSLKQERSPDIQNIYEIPEVMTSSIQDDATIPLGGDLPVQSELEKTIPPDPRHYIGRDQEKYNQGNYNVDNYSSENYKSNPNYKISDEFGQAEHLRMAQQRIFQLEKENDHLRSENDELASAADIVKNRVEEYISKISNLEQELKEEQESFQSEVFILKGSLQHKENDNTKLKLKIEDLEARLRTDFRKIRVRERELENRLELLKAEKLALVRAKDENILELRRKMDTLQNEIESYRSKMLELNHIIDTNQDQFKRTVKALRLALSSLEIKDENVIPLKKAE
ncbi:MAG TPA: hypothetical protein PLJ21_02190 [Pseudobdellovibrionaceae bacterium]|nr:hypothetical protein [Pseudobdellovibrionaceae bacterium]